MSHFIPVDSTVRPSMLGLEQPQQTGPSTQQPTQGPQGVHPGHIAQLQQQGRQVTGQLPLRSLGPSMSTSARALQQATQQWQRTLPPRGTCPKPSA